MSLLRQRTLDELKLFNYSTMTIRNYIDAISGFAKFHGKSPDILGSEDIRAFLLYSQSRGLAPSSLRILRCALLFLFKHVLKKPMEVQDLPSIRQEKRLPMVLSTSEVERLIGTVKNLKHKTILMTFYATGMRLEELRLFHLQNIDSQRMTLKFMGKGKKERYVPLSPVLLNQLRKYWRAYQPKDIFFLSRSEEPYHRRTLQVIFENAKKLAGIKKAGGVHMLRHSFATHLFEANVPAFIIQRILGHNSILTTQKYIRIANHSIASVQSPLDLLDLSALKASV
jgi:site-specific recombinase XerD